MNHSTEHGSLFVQGFHLGATLLLGSLFLGHLLRHGWAGMSIEGRGRRLRVQGILDGLDGELLLALAVMLVSCRHE